MEGMKVYLLKKTVSERKDSSPSPELMLAKMTPTRATGGREASKTLPNDRKILITEEFILLFQTGNIGIPPETVRHM